MIGTILKSMCVLLVALVLTVPTSARANHQWEEGYVVYVEVNHAGHIVLLLSTIHGGPANVYLCNGTHTIQAALARPGEDGVTHAGARNMLAALMSAKLAGKWVRVSVAPTDSTSDGHCRLRGVRLF